jgi:hypothetical protein
VSDVTISGKLIDGGADLRQICGVSLVFDEILFLDVDDLYLG